MASGDVGLSERGGEAAAAEEGPASGFVVGIDVGGTKIAAAAYPAAELRTVAELRQAPSPRLAERWETPDDAEALLDLMSELVERVARQCGPVSALGVGFPGGIEQATGRAVGAVNIRVGDLPLRAELERRLPGCRVAIDNDANVAAFAEAAVRDCSELLLLTLGTGVGGGVVSGGRLLRGADGLGAELGHFPIRADGPPCPGRCPNYGCVEALCSGQALERDAQQLAEAHPDGQIGRLLAAHGRVSARELAAAARAGDADALWLFERFARDLGVALAGYANVFQPRVIALGGGLGSAHDLFLPRALEEARQRALPHIWERCAVEPARAGEAAGTLGAALLAAAGAINP